MEESISDNFSNKDSRWQLVLGYKGKKWRVKDAIDKLARVMKKNVDDLKNNTISDYDKERIHDRNSIINEEIIRLSDIFDFFNAEMQKIITEIHKDSHRK